MDSSLQARKGRDRQRYENNLRLVSGCIPYKLAKDNKDDHKGNAANMIEVCMVSSPNRNDLVFPKGGWEDDETVHEAACREAAEEAGVRGILNGNPLGVWEFRSKSKQDLCTAEGGCRGYMFALEVTEELESWPEQENRYRKWLSIKDASRLCRYDWMRMALNKFLRKMSEELELEIESELELPKEEAKDVVEEVVLELPSTTVSDGSESPIVPPSCYSKPPGGSSHHDMAHISSFSRGCRRHENLSFA